MSSVSIAPFLRNRPAAVSLTFDDGSQDHFDIAFPVLNQFSFKGTFFVIPQLTRDRKIDPLKSGSSFERWGGVSWQEWQKIAEHHEIGNHSLSHQKLTELNSTELESDLESSANLIHEKIGRPPISFCYPWNQWDERVRTLVLKSHLITRDRHDIGFGAPNMDYEHIPDLLKSAVQQRRWLVAMFHGIDESSPSGRSYSITQNIFVKFLQQLKERESDLWIDTFGHIGRYQMAAAATQIRILDKNETSLKVQVACPLDPKKFDIELTLVLQHRWTRKPTQIFSIINGRHQDLSKAIRWKQSTLEFEIPAQSQLIEIR